jgi:hypothetical protein
MKVYLTTEKGGVTPTGGVETEGFREDISEKSKLQNCTRISMLLGSTVSIFFIIVLDSYFLRCENTFEHRKCVTRFS